MNQTNQIIEEVVAKSEGLARELKLRNVVMVGVGGTIGTGVFLGSGEVLHSAGPGGMLLSYLIGGIVMWLMMMCLGELAAAMPASGQVQSWATALINPSMGFTLGWVQYLAAAVTITAQIVASAIMMKNIIPSVPIAVYLVFFILLLLGANMLSVKKGGESFFWVSSLKLILIVVFAIIGLGFITGVVNTGSGAKFGLEMIRENGGWFPNGIMTPILMTLSTAIFAFGGSDIFASTAGEMKNTKDVKRAVTSTAWVLLGSYLITLLVLSLTLPYTSANLLGSPFAYVFGQAGIKSAELIVNIIVLTSALTSGNYFVYTCTRYLWSMAKFAQAPKILQKVDRRKVPLAALFFTMIFAALAIVAAIVAEDTVYFFLLSLIAGANIMIYGGTCLCQFLFRRKFLRDGGDVKTLHYRTPLFPFVPIAGIVTYLLVLVGMMIDPTQRASLVISVVFYLALYLGYHFYRQKHPEQSKYGEQH
ncbi:MAG: amino acid permease [Spirochaetaceae bacterium]|jgi:arginine/ornithine permease|nr:amino acid permease [Spirochaetaceae bacterium]